ncbi:hypothetical protein ACWDV7_03520 [Streptomyces sp. NPDC003362]
MGDFAEITKTVYEILRGSEEVPVQVDSPSLGMAYAIPKYTEDTVVDGYGPWHRAELQQVFYEESSWLGAVLAEVQLIMSWRFSEARQYIIEAYLDKRIVTLDSTVALSITVRFGQPSQYDPAWEAYEIPFHVTVEFDPVGGRSTTLYDGVVRADGSGSFERRP